MALLEVVGLKKDFNLHILQKDIVGLKGICFAVEAGAFLGIVGRSGSGKSSLLKCIYRTYLPSEGAIYLEHEGHNRCMTRAARVSQRLKRWPG